MKLRTVLVPVALLAALVVVTSNAAEAAPLPAKHTKAFFGPRVFVSGGVGVNVPLGRRAYGHRRYVRPAGYWTTVPEEVWTPGRVIGYDRHGHPIMSRGFYQTVYRQVWVEAPVVVRRRHARYVRHVRPRVHVGVGVGTSFRVR